jgi:hypothetical protein
MSLCVLCPVIQPCCLRSDISGSTVLFFRMLPNCCNDGDSIPDKDDKNFSVRFQVLTAASMKMTVFWVVAPCSLVEFYRLDDGGSKHI